MYSHNDAIHINHALAHLYFTAIAFPESEAANHKGHIQSSVSYVVAKLLVLLQTLLHALQALYSDTKPHQQIFYLVMVMYIVSGVYQLTFPCICIIMQMDRRHP